MGSKRLHLGIVGSKTLVNQQHRETPRTSKDDAPSFRKRTNRKPSVCALSKIYLHSLTCGQSSFCLLTFNAGYSPENKQMAAKRPSRGPQELKLILCFIRSDFFRPCFCPSLYLLCLSKHSQSPWEWSNEAHQWLVPLHFQI